MPLSASGYACARLSRDALHVGGGLLESDAGFEPADAVNTETRFAFVEQRIAPLSDRSVDVGRSGGHALEEIEAGGSDADDGVVLAVEVERFSDERRANRDEFSVPEVCADDHDRRARRFRLRRMRRMRPITAARRAARNSPKK